MNSDGSPVTGPVDLKFEVAYSGSTGTIRCTSDVNAVSLTNGVFHAKLAFICPTSSLYEVLSSVPAGEDAVMRVTNETADPDRVYSFQTINAVPVAQMAHQLPKMDATNDQVLTWTGSKWEPKSVTGATGGTVTSVATGSGLTGGPFTTTGTISIATAGVLDSHLAFGIARAKLAGGTPNYVLVNDGSGALTEVAQLPLTQGGTGANTAALARTNLGLGNAAESNIGYSSGNVMPGDGVPVCLSFQKLQFTGTGPTYWSCAVDNDSADASKLPLAGGTMAGAINMNNNFITGVRSPSDPGDAVNKAYVDAQVSGSSFWTSNASNLSYGSGNVGIGNSSPAEKLDVTGNIALTGGLKLQSSSTNYVTLAAPAALSANITYTLPLTAPSNGQILSSSAAGVMSWITPASAITNVFGRTGAVSAASGDYNASLITNSPSGTISGTTVQAALNELDTEKQAVDATLTALAGYNTNGILVQTAADTFAGRSIVGVTNRTNITNGNGVSGNPTIDIDTTLLPSPNAGDIGRFLKTTAANTSVWSSLASGDITTALGFTPINKAGDTIASGTLEFNSAGILKLSNPPVNLTDAVNKQYVDNQITGASNQWSSSSGNLYRATGNIGIGTTSPTVPLAIGGSLFANTSNQIHIVNTGTFSRIAFGEDLNNYGEMIWSDISDHISFNTKRAGSSFSNALVVRDDKVGIGTATPGSALDITKTDPIVRVKNIGGDIGGMFLMNSVNAGWLGMFNPNSSTTFGVIPTLTSKTYLAWDNSGKIGSVSNTFTTGNPGSPVYRNLLDDGSGKMGIGTSSPTEKLDVSGTATMNASTEGISTYATSGTTYTILDSSLNIRRITLNANATINLPAFASMWPKVYTLTVFLKQDAVGSRTVNFNGNGGDTVKWDSGAAPSISLTANKITIVQFTKPSDETVWYGSKVWQED